MRLSFGFLLGLAGVVVLAACGRPVDKPAASPEETVVLPEPGEASDAAEQEQPAGSGFLKLRPPSQPEQRLPEPVPVVPRLVILHDGWPLPESWLKEWKGERLIKIEQRALDEKSKGLAGEASLWVLPPRRVEEVLSGGCVQRLGAIPGEVMINPLFLHHPFDPDQVLSRPLRWTPWVLYHRNKTEQSVSASSELSWTPGSGVGWPNDEPLVEAMWRKSRGGSANRRVAENEWMSVREGLRPAMRPARELWVDFAAGKIERCWLPAAFRMGPDGPRPPLEGVGWGIPREGTLIEVEVMVIPSGAPMGREAESLMNFLSGVAQQDRMTQDTGWLPVHRPFEKLTADASPPLPAGDWMDRSEMVYPTRPLCAEAEATATPHSVEEKEESVPSAPVREGQE